MGFSQALSGLNAASAKLDVLGNNIANTQTVGFKSSSITFADIFAGAGSKIGLGTQVGTTVQDFKTGNLETTGRGLDVAIAGDGFFRFQLSSGEIGYSRNGQLQMTADGYLVNSQGAKIMGYGLNDPNDAFSEPATGGSPVALQIYPDDMPAAATTNVSATYNLDARIDESNADLLSQARVFDDAADPAGSPVDINYHYSNSFTVFDSLGTARNVTVYYEKTGANAWSAKVAIDGFYKAANDFTLAFDSSGKLVDITHASAAGTADDRVTIDFSTAELGGEPSPLSFEFVLDGSTQFSNTSTQNALTQDGYTSGTLVGLSIEADGTVMRKYSNERSASAGQIVLASFRNAEGLSPIGDNMWQPTVSAGSELVGIAGSGSLGALQAGAVETSNVDLAKQLVDMIVTQRAYQANSQTIKTQDELLQTSINLR
ncbi:flagellar hook protein FlgE [Thauera aromatica]|uniref:Flagellar hook protein FlgE n=1 Tax=Thauera aromatica K172 TaxID=44139 RepID=A0A2R4BJ54_THAAR|nr:flagellar hook protein FlgE [Thauera aromatica]AVR87283.1 Flagellar hook protein FlgE [Thauera aromatica K172]